MNSFQQDMEREFIELAQKTFETPTFVEINISTLDLFQIVAHLQFAHRGAAERPDIQAHIKQYAQRLTDVLTVMHPEISSYLERGWNTAYDVRSDTGQWINPNAAIAAELIRDFEQEQPQEQVEPSQVQPSQAKPHRIVHNVWTLYAVEADGSLAENPLMCFGQRPQDWGHPRWSYECYAYTRTFEVETITETITNVCHTWTDWPDLDNQKRAEIFAKMMTLIMQPGCDPHLCDRRFLGEEDFWAKEWGEAPPYYENSDDPDEYMYFGFIDDDEVEAESAPEIGSEPDTPDLDDYYECHLFAYFGDNGAVFVPSSEIDPSELQNTARVNIPFITAEAIYGYVIYIAGKSASELALGEMIVLKQMVDRIHEKYQDLAERKNK